MTNITTRPGDTPRRRAILRRPALVSTLTLTSVLLTVAIASQAHAVTGSPGATIDTPSGVVKLVSDPDKTPPPAGVDEWPRG